MIYNMYFDLDWDNSIIDKTSLFANQDDKYKEKDLKKTVNNLGKTICM